MVQPAQEVGHDSEEKLILIGEFDLQSGLVTIFHLPICSRSLLKVSPTITTYPVIAANIQNTVTVDKYNGIQHFNIFLCTHKLYGDI